MKYAADYLICYDIADPRRVQKMGRELDKLAIRIQYSVFYAPSATQEMLFDIIETIDGIIEPEEDDVRIYTVLHAGVRLGRAVDLADVTTLL